MNIQLGINEEKRKEIVKKLKQVLSDTALLYLKTHNFHWNVEGPWFNTLHQMFMDQYTEMWNSLDEIAERIRALGEYAPGTYQEFINLSKITETPSVPKATEMIRQLIDGHQILVQSLRETLEIAEQAHDQVTSDLLTQRLNIHEKTAWMLRSLLKD